MAKEGLPTYRHALHESNDNTGRTQTLRNALLCYDARFASLRPRLYASFRTWQPRMLHVLS